MQDESIIHCTVISTDRRLIWAGSGVARNALVVVEGGGEIPPNIFGHDFQSFFQEINIAENKRRRSRRADGGGPDSGVGEDPDKWIGKR